MQGLSSVAPLTDERCNYNLMIEYVTIRKLKYQKDYRKF